MYCNSCGTEIPAGASFCTNCGAPVPVAQEATFTGSAPAQDTYTYAQEMPTYQVPVAGQDGVIYNRAENAKNLLLAAFIVNVISTVVFAVLILPLAWMIPMTVHSYGIYKGKKPNTVAFGVCTLIFLDIISGVLMLIADKDA